MSFASKNRAAMANASGAPPGTFVPPMVFGPPAPTFTPDPYVGPVYTPPPRETQPYVAPEVQWVAGVPNFVTGLTAVAVAYAAYLAVTGEPRKNPSDDPSKPFKMYATPAYQPLESVRFVASYATLAAATKAAKRIAKERRGAAVVESYSKVLHREDWHGVP